MPLPLSVPHGRIEHIPRVHEFDIGQYPGRVLPVAQPLGDRNTIIVLEREQNRRNTLIYGLVENTGEDLDFDFSVEESGDNAIADAYASFSIRVGASSVASVTVKPKGQAEFLIEGLTERFIRLLADPQDDVRGRVTITHFFGELIRRHQVAVP